MERVLRFKQGDEVILENGQGAYIDFEDAVIELWNNNIGFINSSVEDIVDNYLGTNTGLALWDSEGERGVVIGSMEHPYYKIYAKTHLEELYNDEICLVMLRNGAVILVSEEVLKSV